MADREGRLRQLCGKGMTGPSQRLGLCFGELGSYKFKHALRGNGMYRKQGCICYFATDVAEYYYKKQNTEDRIYFDMQLQSGLGPLSGRHGIQSVRSA